MSGLRGRLGSRQPPLGLGQLTPQPGDLDLVGVGTTDPRTGRRTLQDARVTKPTPPLRDQRGVQALAAQVDAPLPVGAGRLAGLDMRWLRVVAPVCVAVFG